MVKIILDAVLELTVFAFQLSL